MHESWQALRATTAAPGYFGEISFGRSIHHDGSVLINNPCALAIHEARRIWGPTTPLECVVSLGTGRPLRRTELTEKVSWLDMANTVINSATDSTRVHHILKDLLPVRG
jgi:calcium-independent phospholipase A2-gamma